MKKPLLTLNLAILAIVLTVLAACNKISSTPSSLVTNPNHIPADQTVTASLQGRVLDQNGVPVQGAAVTSGTATASTDVNGVFSFSKINMSSRFGYVQAAKTGFFTGSRSIITNPGGSNYVTIQLLPKTVATGTFPAPSGGDVMVATGDSADFAPASVMEASSGSAYTGMVTVYATYLNPTDPSLYKYMPGDLRGIGADGYETGLQSFGMMDVEMQDASGNKLQLMSGQTAKLIFAIPDTLLAVAPATIPLWYFNDSTGRWIQQGTAVKQGNNYVGTVGHFTYWNCAAPMATVNFKVKVKDQFGNPLAYTYVEFVSADWGVRGDYTDSTGLAQGLIPKSEALLMQIVTECGGLIGGVNVGPALTDQDLGTVKVTVLDQRIIVMGTVVDCSSNPVDSGYVTVQVDGLNYAALVSNGSFILPVLRCYTTTADVKATAADLATSQVGTSTTVPGSSPAADTVNVGQLSACGSGGSTPPPPPPPPPPSLPTSGQYFSTVIAGTTTIWADANSTISQNLLIPPTTGTAWQAANTSTGAALSMVTSSGVTATGTYGAYIQLNLPGYTGGAVTVTVTTLGAVGSGYFTGTYSGTVLDTNTSQNVPITGAFNVTRML